MKCEEYQEMASEYIDGEMRDEETVGLFTHLASCPQCRSFLGMIVRVRQSVATTPRPEVRPELDVRVNMIPDDHARVRARRRVVAPWFWQNRVHLPVPALATIIFIALFSSAVLLVSWLHSKEMVPPTNQQVVYIIGLEPVEVQGSYTEAAHLPQ